jgi:cytochrome c peroxidase
MHWHRLTIGAAGLGALLAASCRPQPPEEPVVFSASELREIGKLSPLPPPPSSPTNAVADDPGAALLGQRLFFNARLSANGSVACATCHDPEKGFSDAKPLSEGIATTDRHAQSLWNMAYGRWFFWDGRADSLWAQALQPMRDEREMGASIEHLQSVVTEDPTLTEGYQRVFGPAGEHSAERFFSNLGKALEAYQRRLISTDSPFDQFADALQNTNGGKQGSQLDESARRGLRLFVGRGCTNCHAGPNFSDGEFHNIGLPKHPELPRDSGRFEGIRKLKADRFNGTGEFSDDRSEEANIKNRYLVVKLNNLGEFKTPSLRHVAESAPYMHDGRFASLREVLDFYSELPEDPPLGHREETLQPLDLSEQEKTDLEAFLRSLTGAQLDADLLRAP